MHGSLLLAGVLGRRTRLLARRRGLLDGDAPGWLVLTIATLPFAFTKRTIPGWRATMRPLVILATFAMMSLVGCAETEETIRPNGGANLQPRTSTSPVAAPLPVDLQITPPPAAADLPGAKAA